MPILKVMKHPQGMELLKLLLKENLFILSLKQEIFHQNQLFKPGFKDNLVIIRFKLRLS